MIYVLKLLQQYQKFQIICIKVPIIWNIFKQLSRPFFYFCLNLSLLKHLCLTSIEPKFFLTHITKLRFVVACRFELPYRHSTDPRYFDSSYKSVPQPIHFLSQNRKTHVIAENPQHSDL
jgi:hypothetical protein